MGTYSYTNILKKEGFPSISIPYIVITTPYLSDDSAKTEADITLPIYEVVAEVEGVKELRTTSTSNMSIIVIQLEKSAGTPEEVKKEVEASIASLSLPSKSIAAIPDFSRVDGENDLIFSIYEKDVSAEELESKATAIQDKLLKSSLVQDVNIKSRYSEQLNFATGEIVTAQKEYSRVAVREGGRLNAYDSLNIGVVKSNGDVGTLEFSDEVQRVISEATDSGSLKGVEVVYTGDPAQMLNAQINSLETNAMIAIFTIFVILLFFINGRSALILVLFIPLTLAGVFTVFALAGLSLNTISLFSLVLVLGLFVDDGTIVVEAIDTYKRQGYKRLEAVRRAINDIGVADISGTLTTLLVFVPLLAIQGVLGDFIRILPTTVIISLIVSLVIALAILPLISMYLIPEKRDGKEKESIWTKVTSFIPKLIVGLTDIGAIYTRAVISNRYLRFVTISGSLILIGIGFYYATKLQFAYFAPASDSDEISLSISFDRPLPIEEAEKYSVDIEKQVVDKYGQYIDEMAYFSGNSSGASLRFNLVPMAEREITSTEIAEGINAQFENIPGRQLLAKTESAGPPESQYPFAMQVYSSDVDQLKTVTSEIESFIYSQRLPKGVDIVDVKVGDVEEVRKLDGERYVEVMVKFSENSDSATSVELKKRISDKYTDSHLAKLSGERGAVLLGFDFGQETENAESFNSVVYAGIIAMLAIYALLVLQFNSFTQPLLILVAIPFSFPGLFAGLYYTGNPMSFFVVIGLTGLIGIVVNNTIMLIEYANSRYKDSQDLGESITEAVRLRTRPIMATSLTTIAGLLPLALTEPFWEPLAYTIVFGLISSVLLITFAFPSYYYVVQRGREVTRQGLNRLGSR